MKRSKHLLSRRGLAGLFVWTGAGFYFGGCGDDTGGPGEQGGKRVVVLGGGLAGLTAAHELQQRGYTVTVLEGRDRVGGRVWTKRDGFEGGQYAEVGAVRIPDVHERTLFYCDKFGLTLDPFLEADAVYYLDGKRFLHVPDQPWPLDGLTAEEADKGFDMWGVYIQPVFDEFGDPRDGSFPRAGIVDKWDPVVYSDFLRMRGASEAFLKLYASDNGSEIDTIGTLAWIAPESADRDWGGTFHIRDGNDQLPLKFAEAVGMDNIILSARVTKIEHRDDGVVVTYEKDGAPVTIEGDWLVSAIPFTMLRDVEISPPFGAEKTKAINEAFMMNAGRGYIQTKTRFWEKEGIAGLKLAKTDTKIERMWNLSEVLPEADGRGMILSYTQSKNADAYCDLAPEAREAYTLDEIEKFFPEIKDEKLVFFHYCWKEDPWSKGAWTDILPNQWWYVDIARRPEGRVFFCGEHTSVWAGWMQGAIESGERVADEIAAMA